jgi:hypothetical protein
MPTLATSPADRRARAGLALASSAATILLVYALVRVVQAIWFPEPNPAVVIWSARAGLYWRFFIGGFAGGMVGIAAWATSARDAPAVARWTARGIAAAAIAIALQGALVP